MARWRIFVPWSHDQILFSDWEIFARMDAFFVVELDRSGRAGREILLGSTKPVHEEENIVT